MRYNLLGETQIKVSEVCLGTMTWGRQNNQQDADQQIEYALSTGINFVDTAEMYAIPPTPETYGKTESIIGSWLSRNPTQRKNIVLATKMAGVGLSWIRNGAPISPDTLKEAVEQSLNRLKTDYIDLYQLHWPNRTSPHFGKHWPEHLHFSGANKEEEQEQILGILQALQSCVEQGKIRHVGLSNETPWGLSQYLNLSKQYQVPRVVSLQNEFNLAHTKDWPYQLEQCCHEKVSYLAWSPLAGGVLSGKYLNGERPSGSRWTIAQRNGLFRDTPAVTSLVEQLVCISRTAKLTPSQLALAWCRQVPGVASTIIGATTLGQLKEDIAAFDGELDASVLAQLNVLLRQYPMPF